MGVLVLCVFTFRLGQSMGADELDMVINEGLFKMKDYNKVKEEIDKICDVSSLPVKVIVETSKLSSEEIIEACKIVGESKAKFIKTSTGFIGDGAKLEDVKLMKKYLSNDKQIKASGGIRDKETMIKFIQAGATRIGTSSGVKIMEDN